MPEKNYQDRDVLGKLGIKPGHAVAFAGAIDAELRQRIRTHTGRPPATEDESVDVVLAMLNPTDNLVELLKNWRMRLAPDGGIWLLTMKRGQPGYIDQRELIAAGKIAEVVDNKICSISSTISAMRFVIRLKDREV